MNDNLHFSKSPLTEAIIDIQISPPDGFEVERLQDVQKGYEAEYPTRRNKIYFQQHFPMKDGNISAEATQSSLIGYDFVSRDEKQVLRVKIDGFSFNRLAPYKSWESFRNEARKWWEIYRNITKPSAITRLAVRYINKLDVPMPFDLEDYLKTSPKIAPDLPQTLSGYAMQLRVPYDDIGATLVLNQALAPPPSPLTASVIFDIDIFRKIDTQMTEDEMWDYFEQLRDKKNETFIACITEETRRLIE